MLHLILQLDAGAEMRHEFFAPLYVYSSATLPTPVFAPSYITIVLMSAAVQRRDCSPPPFVRRLHVPADRLRTCRPAQLYLIPSCLLQTNHYLHY